VSCASGERSPYWPWLALVVSMWGVDGARDGQVGTTCLMLVDDRGAFAVVAHPGHQFLQARAASCRQVVPGVPEIAKVQAFGANRADGVRPGRHLVEIAAAQRAALDPGKLRASASGPTNRDRCSRRAGIIDEGMPTIRRLLWTSAGRAPVPPWTVPRRPRARERCLRPGKGRRGSKGLSSRSWEPGPT